MSEAQGEVQPTQPHEAPDEVQRHLPGILTELAHKATDGAVAGAAGYYAKKGLEKFGGRKPLDEPPSGGTAPEPGPGDDPPPLPWPG